MTRIGNFLFHYRNGLFPLAYLLLFAKTSLIVNLDAARALDITLPPALVRSAREVIRDTNGNR